MRYRIGMNWLALEVELGFVFLAALAIIAAG